MISIHGFRQGICVLPFLIILLGLLNPLSADQVTIPAPVFDPPAGTYSTAQILHINTPVPDSAVVRYTTNGTNPTTSSPEFPSEGYPLDLNTNPTIKVRAFLDGWGFSPVYTATYIITGQINIPAPQFNPVAGTYKDSQVVYVTAPIPSDALIRYRTDGVDPVESSPLYNNVSGIPLGLEQVYMLKVKAFKTGWEPSPIYTAQYNMTGTARLETPVFTFAPGTYTGAINLGIGVRVPSTAVVRYTLDGSDPGSSSQIFPASGLILQENNIYNLKVRAFHPDWYSSQVYSGIYIVMGQVMINAPIFTPNPNTYTSNQNISIGSASPITATVRYTLDGSEPLESSSVYNDPIALNTGQHSIKVRAFAPGYLPSPVYNGNYTITGTLQLPSQLFYPAPGIITGPVSVSLNTTGLPVGTTLLYSINSATPTTLYTGPISLAPSTSNQVIRVKAQCPGWIDSGIQSGTYAVTGQVTLDGQVFQPEPGIYTPPRVLQINTALIQPDTTGVRIRYTTDGSEPNDVPANAFPAAGYTFNSNSSTQVKIRLFKDNWLPSPVYSGVFTVTGTIIINEPVFNLTNGNTYLGDQLLLANSTTPSGAEVHYTLDDSDPNQQSPLFPAQGLLLPEGGSSLIKVRSYKQDWLPSDIDSIQVTLEGQFNGSIEFIPPAGVYAELGQVSISGMGSLPDGYEIYFSTDDSDPDSLFSSPIQIPAGNSSFAIKAWFSKDGWQNSAIFSSSYTINGQVHFNDPVFNLPADQQYSQPQLLLVNSTIPSGAFVRYTSDNSEPNAGSPVFPAQGLLLSQSTTIRIRAYLQDWLPSDVKTIAVTINGQMPNQVSFTPPAGLYANEVSVVLGMGNNPPTGSNVYFSTDGSDPDSLYTQAITIPLGTPSITIKARIIHPNWQPGPIIQATYQVPGRLVVSDLSAAPDPGTYANPISVHLSYQISRQDAVLRYSLDGSEPGIDHPIYSHPLYLEEGDHNIKVKAFLVGWLASETHSLAYRVRSYPSYLHLDQTIDFDGTNKLNYRLVGIPGAQQVAVNQLTYGDLDIHWRAFNELGDVAAPYSELVSWSETNSFAFGPGNGYWVLSKYPLHLSMYSPSVPLDSDLCHNIALHPGWNIISNPFTDTLRWGDIQAINGTNAIAYSYHRGFSPIDADSLFMPFEGYYFINMTGSDYQLKIPWKYAVISGSRAELQGVEVRLTTDIGSDRIVVGHRPDASSSLDQYDQLAPPEYFCEQGLKLENGQYKHEYRPQGPEIFNFTVNRGTSIAQILHVSTGGLTQPAYLWDKADDSFTPLADDYEFALPPNHMIYAIVSGDEQFIDQIREGLIPESVVVSSNWPNPFNHFTNIKAVFNSEAEVDVDVYNIRGQLVMRLGSRQKVCRGTTEWIMDSSELASGIYLCRIRWRSGSEAGEKTIKMTRLGK